MEILEINTATLKSDATTIQEKVESISTLVDNLEDSMEKLAGCWEGAAWGTYQYYMSQNIETLTDIYKEMSDYTTNMQEAAKLYEKTEDNVHKTIKSIWV